MEVVGVLKSIINYTPRNEILGIDTCARANTRQIE